MSNRIVYFNGRYVPEREARVSIFDSGLLYGEFAFEMIRTFRHRPFQLRSHLERLQNSLDFLQIDAGLGLNELERLTFETLEKNLPTESAEVDWHIRCDISRGPAELFSSVFPEGLGPTVLISCWPLVKALGRFAPNYDRGVKVIVSGQKSIPPDLVDPRAKTRSRVHFQLAQLEAARQSPDSWPVLTDGDGFLTEGPSWNIFAVKEGRLISPVGDEILHGVSRSITIAAAAESGIPTIEENISPAFARSADEIFCTATSFGIVHASSFDGVSINGGRAGPILQKLLPYWKAEVGLDFIAQARRYAELLPDWEAAEKRSAS